MYDDDQDTLAAEYVLGTLSRDEREQASALLAIDSGFAAVVRSWERRLGELNVMVEAVEPPSQTWDKIKAAATGVAPIAEIQLPLIERAPAVAVPVATPAPAAVATPAAAPAAPEPSPAVPEVAPAKPAAATPSVAVPPPSTAPAAERSADVVYLTRRIKRWRRVSAAMGALAAVLALAIVLPAYAPDLIPTRWRLPGFFQAKAPTGNTAAGPMVAVLQQDPGTPAFLLTIDPSNRMLTVRRVAAAPEPNRSYELWLVSKNFPAPRSLGLVGAEEFTRRPIPANYDAETVGSGTYAVSLEPTGGSPRGVPTGPVLFTGKLIESQPPPPQPAPRT